MTRRVSFVEQLASKDKSRSATVDTRWRSNSLTAIEVTARPSYATTFLDLLVWSQEEFDPYKSTTLVPLPFHSKDIDLTRLEDQTTVYAGFEEEVLPTEIQPRLLQNFRHRLFYAYRRLFGVVFLVNCVVFIRFAVKGASTPEIATAVSANLTCAILMRQEYVINVLFLVFTSIPRSWPLWLRTLCARIYHLGGLHSGAAISGTLWLILLCGKATGELVRHQGTSGATLCFSYAILILLCVMLIFAYPSNREKAHNTFEATHRFMGWSAIILVWGLVLLLTNDHKGERPLHRALVHNASFWLTAIQTISLALPWLYLKKVPVRCEKLSDHALRLYFDYTTPGCGSFVRLSDSPLAEWHSFAAFSEPEKEGFSVIISRTGDWTSKMISDPPTHIWKRGLPTYGVVHITKMFNRIVLVATGSGIGPCMPVIVRMGLSIRLLWIAPNVRETFGDKLVDQVLSANPEAVIYNTREYGKPDMVKLVWRLVKLFDAEAVVIISNKPLTDKVVYGMVSRGIPAFGAIWDS